LFTSENCLQLFFLELLKPEGKLVYATCSLLPSENEEQVKKLVARDPRWVMEAELKISPSEQGWDGFYAFRIGRSAND
jgi:16S rRNA (cytosine967-C5)-methyltransferase